MGRCLCEWMLGVDVGVNASVSGALVVDVSVGADVGA